MSNYSLAKNGSTYIDLYEDYRDNGWTISETKAIHSGCNQGDIALIESGIVAGVVNQFEYVVSGYSSGNVRLKVGSYIGPARTANGKYIETLTPGVGDQVSFYSDGNLTVEVLSIYSAQVQPGRTLLFDEKGNHWVGELTFEPDMMSKFLTGFFSFKNGELWEHNVNDLHNTFYGAFSPSEITFYVNTNPKDIKTLGSIEIKSNEVWSLPVKGDIKTYPIKGKSQGMVSRLKKGRFKNYQGIWFADFMRSMNDPRFNDELLALSTGAVMQGDVFELRIVNDSTGEVRLMHVTVTMSKQNFTF